MKFTGNWEQINNSDMVRMWLPTGWLVRDSHWIIGTVSAQMKTETFVYDPEHLWEI